ncbi:MAG TPA: plastocyanin/azurin family copper-binding protein [Ilumatobacteraceae bacterium]|nr:plastocyanin/azurin family copper-binding protein [Ilumatobacteraceae bacterium]HRB03335.1 plastocyanin/azurin family copper-binding protein [Ilumatobacteraceae bacterium]
MRQLIGIGVIVLAVSSLSACAKDPDDSVRAVEASAAAATTLPLVTVAQSPDTFPANGKTETVKALDNNFLPEALTIEAGTEVVWDNIGRNDHDVTPADEPDAATWGVTAEAFAPKDTYSHVFDQPGTYAYFCTIHGTAKAGMIGTIVVTPPAG